MTSGMTGKVARHRVHDQKKVAVYLCECFVKISVLSNLRPNGPLMSNHLKKLESSVRNIVPHIDFKTMR